MAFVGAVVGVVVAAGVLLLGLAPAAQAHSVLLATTPAASGQVATSPADIVLTFNEMPRQRYSTVIVTGPDGARRDSGTVRVVDDNLSQALGGTRPAGTYTVDWRVISSDGHPISGRFTYTASAAGPALAAVQAAPAADAGGGGVSVVVIVVIVVVVLVVLAGIVVALRRRRATSSGGPVRARSGAAGHLDRDDDDDQ